jgi:hypothetical protein
MHGVEQKFGEIRNYRPEATETQRFEKIRSRQSLTPRKSSLVDKGLAAVKVFICRKPGPYGVNHFGVNHTS